MKIFVSLSARALGDFIAYATLASSIREMFDTAQLYIYFRGDRPYKQHIVSCIRNLESVISVPEKSGGIPVDFFDAHQGRPSHQIEFWEKNGLYNTDLIIAGHMLNEAMLNAIPATTLAPSPQTMQSSDEALMARGLDPNKWFACVYWKEDGYAYRPFNNIRTIFDPAPYVGVIRYIIESMGGQVVRLGHPTPTEVPPMPGFVDLAKVEGSEWLQMYAVSRARFFVASASGPAAYGPAFGVPTANTDQNLCYGVWGPQDYVVTQDIQYNDKWYRQTEAYDAGLLFSEFKPDKSYRLSRNTVKHLSAAADDLFKITMTCPGWRTPGMREIKGPRPNSITLPLPRRYRRDLLIPPSQRVS